MNDFRITGGCVFRKTFSQPLVDLAIEFLTGADEPVNFPLYEFSGRSEGEDTSIPHLTFPNFVVYF